MYKPIYNIHSDDMYLKCRIRSQLSVFITMMKAASADRKSSLLCGHRAPADHVDSPCCSSVSC